MKQTAAEKRARLAQRITQVRLLVDSAQVEAWATEAIALGLMDSEFRDSMLELAGHIQSELACLSRAAPTRKTTLAATHLYGAAAKILFMCSMPQKFMADIRLEAEVLLHLAISLGEQETADGKARRAGGTAAAKARGEKTKGAVRDAWNALPPEKRDRWAAGIIAKKVGITATQVRSQLKALGLGASQITNNES